MAEIASSIDAVTASTAALALASPAVPSVETVVAVEDAPEAAAAEEALTLRSLVSSKEAGVIIGRGGANIATMRSESNVKAGVSKVVPGVADRILSIGGTVEGVAQAYSLVAQTILDNPPTSSQSSDGTILSTPPPATSTTIRLLISHLLIGSVIGKGGIKIRAIQDLSSARMVASKEMLPQSTERIVEVTGNAESVGIAILEIAKCLIEDWDRSQGTVLYYPGTEGSSTMGGMGQGYPGQQYQQSGQSPTASSFGARRISASNSSSFGGARRASGNNGDGRDFAAMRSGSESPMARRTSAGGEGGAGVSSSDPNYREQKISIPADMVGCIIGRGGTKINEIRRLSGSKISIAKTPHDDTGERMFVISGLPEHNEKALFLLYNQLESEKERRVQSVAEDGTEEV